MLKGIIQTNDKQWIDCEITHQMYSRIAGGTVIAEGLLANGETVTGLLIASCEV